MNAKLSVLLPISTELLNDRMPAMTPEEIAEAERRWAQLKAEGRVADDNLTEIKPTDCPKVYYAGHEGDETFFCGRRRGHNGRHVFRLEWD